ncbi:MAG: hypothetical protein XD60_1827 [Acetothermia bacterium 64_32]|nr:MAG: hypothetical protein XD60_1827 [Acetothermia bacterium 64_32]MBC7098848.1 hypothetical protein [Candidatus Bipolaricaulota bacterium]HAF71287.1 hypothetical protein [Candidatus Acetothermia bacterium]
MDSLAEFLKEKKRSSSQIKERQRDLREEWQKAVSNLFEKIENWLAPASSEGLNLKWYETELDEGDLGKYVAPALELEFEGIRVKIEPVGRLVIGARGRVDISSPLGVHHLVRLGPEEDDWYLVRDGVDERKRLTKQTLEELLKEIFALA